MRLFSIPLEIFSTVLLLLSPLTHAASLTFTIPSSPHLPNPSHLPSSTRATLFKHNTTLTAPLTIRNTFEFSDLPSGSYLFTVQARDHTFGPLRVDVLNGGTDPDGRVQEGRIDAWTTFWGNAWRDKGEWSGGSVGVGKREGDTEKEGEREASATVEIMAEGVKNFYQVRSGFDVLSFLKSPMILMALVSLVMIVGIPYLTENMDEDTKAEFEEMQRKSPISQATAAGRGGFENFDLASWMAGKTSGGGAGGNSSNAGSTDSGSKKKR